ncbi:hypothetical protein DFS28_10221 [Pseudomonas sp. 478]|nr:hypothetical protein DFS28_10221 [Pseudomonas sp. 478]TCV55947.1 hypothetical protein EDB99_10221 [Pseudomonas sp. 460]
MRRGCEWFTNRAESIWKSQPGRSMLLLVPQGCDETSAAEEVISWTSRNFKPPKKYNAYLPICLRVTSDSIESSEHFAITIARKISRKLNIPLELEDGDFPSDILQNAVEAALNKSYFPILIIERFHAFAMIPDWGMGSVLSRMRSLEHAGQLTTLTFSPFGYEMIRRSMDAAQPFLNSVYGDNHDQAVMTPLSKSDFLHTATILGVAAPRAHWLYAKGGGPDMVYRELINAASMDDDKIIDHCIARTGATIDKFLERSFAEAGVDRQLLLAALALGRLAKPQEAFLLNNPLSDFVAKKKESGELTCSSQIIARRILQGNQPKWALYGQCLEAFSEGDLARAGELAKMLDDEAIRLVAFRGLITLLSAVTFQSGRGLLGIEWDTASKISKQLIEISDVCLEPFTDWIQRMFEWSKVILNTKGANSSRLQADAFTKMAADRETRLILLFMMSSLVKAAERLNTPLERVMTLVNIPEAILQSLAAGFCGIDYSNAPNETPAADYSEYFGSSGQFNFPTPGKKIALSSLLVIVPAILKQKKTRFTGRLIDTSYIKPLHQKLIDYVRNPASHTFVAFSEKDANFLLPLCNEWIETWLKMEGFNRIEDLPGVYDAPNLQKMSEILFG